MSLAVETLMKVVRSFTFCFHFFRKFFCFVITFYFCSCSLETLSTLKFAQRAKFIKNNVRYFNTVVDVIQLELGDGSIHSFPSNYQLFPFHFSNFLKLMVGLC